MTRAARTRRRALAVLVLLVGWATAAVGSAWPASAHAELIGTDPADGARLAAAPPSVTLTFSENVSFGTGGYLKVTDSRGDAVSVGDVQHPAGNGAKAQVRLRPGLKNSSYLVSYRIVSADSHPVGGAYAFVVGDGPLVAATGALLGGRTDRTVSAVFTVARWVSFAGVVLLAGLVFVVVCWPAGRTDPRARRLLWSGWAAAAAASVAGLLLEGPYAAGTGIGAALDRTLLGGTLGTTYGRMLSARFVALAVLAVLMLRLLRPLPDPAPDADRGRTRDEDLAAITGLALLATYGGIGHAAAGSQPTLALLSDTVHLGAMATWFGGLLLLACCLLPARRAPELAGALPTFSRIAFGCVTTLAVTGTYQAWREVAPLPALWSTGYGQLLMVKIAGFLLLVGLGNLGRLAVRRRYLMPVARALAASSTPATDDTRAAADGGRGGGGEDDRLVGRLRSSVAVELGIGAVVLALAAVLVSQAPARSTYAPKQERTVQLTAGRSARVTVQPARPGAAGVQVQVLDRGGAPVSPPRVALTLALPSDGYGPVEVSLTGSGAGRYRSVQAAFPKPGGWRLVLTVTYSTLDVAVGETDVTIR